MEDVGRHPLSTGRPPRVPSQPAGGHPDEKETEMARRNEVDLTGSRAHRALRNLAAECTPNDDKRKERREAFDRDFGNCACGSGAPARKCGCVLGG